VHILPDDSEYGHCIIGLEKFAQLIVQECVIIVAGAVDHREPASTYVDKIKQHFGVEQ
jgi:predicted ABC-type sugar transport system permease subunit